MTAPTVDWRLAWPKAASRVAWASREMPGSPDGGTAPCSGKLSPGSSYPLHPSGSRRLEEMAAESRVPILRLGRTGGSTFTWGRHLNLPVQRMAETWRSGLGQA